MTPAQRRARATVWRCGVECEIALSIAASTQSDQCRQRSTERAERLADLAFRAAPSTQPQLQQRNA